MALINDLEIGRTGTSDVYVTRCLECLVDVFFFLLFLLKSFSSSTLVRPG